MSRSSAITLQPGPDGLELRTPRDRPGRGVRASLDGISVTASTRSPASWMRWGPVVDATAGLGGDAGVVAARVTRSSRSSGTRIWCASSARHTSGSAIPRWRPDHPAPGRRDGAAPEARRDPWPPPRDHPRSDVSPSPEPFCAAAQAHAGASTAPRGPARGSLGPCWSGVRGSPAPGPARRPRGALVGDRPRPSRSVQAARGTPGSSVDQLAGVAGPGIAMLESRTSTVSSTLSVCSRLKVRSSPASVARLVAGPSASRSGSGMVTLPHDRRSTRTRRTARWVTTPGRQDRRTGTAPGQLARVLQFDGPEEGGSQHHGLQDDDSPVRSKKSACQPFVVSARRAVSSRSPASWRPRSGQPITMMIAPLKRVGRLPR